MARGRMPAVHRFTVVICTRDRPDQLAASLAALQAQTDRRFDILVVDQSAAADRSLDDSRDLRVVRDPGRGLSRARNLALAATDKEWIAFIDDDCLVDRTWAAEVNASIARHPEVDFITGHVDEGDAPAEDHVGAAARPIQSERTLRGRWTGPEELGYGVMMVVRRATAQRLGGWDERLGAGTAPFPAGEDMDFAFRLLRAGGAALATPSVRGCHQQWRSPAETVRLYRGYARSDAAFAIKHLRTGDVLGGLWIWTRSVREMLRVFVSSARHRSPLRLRIAAVRFVGLAEGSISALRLRW